MTNETNALWGVISEILGLFEKEFGPNCPYHCPFSLDFAQYAFDEASSNLNLEGLINEWNNLPLDESVEQEERPIENTEEILDIVKKYPAWEWSPETLFYSATFFILEYNLRTKGKLYQNIWRSLPGSPRFPGYAK